MDPVQFSAMQCVQSLVYSIRTNCDYMGGIDKVRSEVDLSADGQTVLKTLFNCFRVLKEQTI